MGERLRIIASFEIKSAFHRLCNMPPADPAEYLPDKRARIPDNPRNDPSGASPASFARRDCPRRGRGINPLGFPFPPYIRRRNTSDTLRGRHGSGCSGIAPCSRTPNAAPKSSFQAPPVVVALCIHRRRRRHARTNVVVKQFGLADIATPATIGNGLRCQFHGSHAGFSTTPPHRIPIITTLSRLI